MLIGVPREHRLGETRVAATPKTVGQLIGLGYEVVVETGAGVSSAFTDAAYAAAGATIGTGDEAWAADIVFHVNPPSDDEIALLRSGATLVSLMSPALQPELVDKLAERGVTGMAMDMVPRISRAQSLDVLSSMANIAGYRAVIEAATCSAASSPARSPPRARCRRRRSSSREPAWPASPRSARPAPSARSCGRRIPGPRWPTR